MGVPVVTVATVEPRLIAAVRSRTTLANLPEAIRAGLDHVWPQIRRPLAPARPGLNVVLYHASEPTNLGKEFEIDAGVEVDAGFKPSPPVYLTQTPSGRVVTAAHFGPYDQMAGAYDAIQKYVRENHLSRTGPSWEVYGHWSDDPAKVRTDIFFTLA